jgi:HSP90 family molecular chaperone
MRASELKLNDQLVVVKLTEKNRKVLLLHKASGDHYELYTDEIHAVNVEQLAKAARAVLPLVRQFYEDFVMEITAERAKTDAVQRLLATINQMHAELECWPKEYPTHDSQPGEP